MFTSASSSAKRAWGLAVLALFLASGMLMVGQTLGTTPNEAIMGGALLVLLGIIQTVLYARARRWRDVFLFLLGGLLSILAVVLVVRQAPLEWRIISLALVAALTLGGALRFLAAFRERVMPAKWLAVLTGLVGIAIGVRVYLTLPWSSPMSIAGTLVGIEVTFGAVSVIALSLARRGGNAASADPSEG